MLHKLTSKLLFACPNAHWFPHFFGFPVSHACLLWAATIFSDKRSTRLLPKLLLVLKCTTLLNLSRILCCELVHWPTWSILAAKSVSQESLCIRKLLVLDLTKEIYITYESMKTWQRKWCSWDWAVMVKVRVFLLGVLFVSKHLHVHYSRKERFRRLLSLPSELLLTADERRNTVSHRLVLIMDHASRTRPQRH